MVAMPEQHADLLTLSSGRAHDDNSSSKVLGLFQIERVEAFGEPAVDRSQKLASLIPFPLSRQSRARLITARSSQDFACC
jgi:hypothetical protein